jgi:hypothetical protein
MSKYLAAALAFAIATLPVGGASQSPNPAINATGNWNVNPTGLALASGMLKLRQDGSTVVGTYGQGGTIDGKFEPGTLQVDATWSDSRGKGWMTIVFAADGNRFSGEWGRPGSKPSGHFDAARSVYPIVTGRYHISVTGGTEFTTREISLRQLGLDVVGNYGRDTQLNGTMAMDSNTFTGTWQGASGHGWMKLKFADDSKSFEGAWGVVAGTEPSGQMTGSIVNTAQLWVRGLWNVASSGAAFTTNALKFEQEGQTVTASYNGGHLQGMLPRGSYALTGTWRDSRGTGSFVFKFASDGKSFQGTWFTKSHNNGSIIGKRVIAAMPALHQ